MTDLEKPGAVARHGGRMMLFGGVGVINTLTDFIIYAALVFAGIHPAGANLVSFLSANAQSYVINARVTFREGGAPAAMSLNGYGKFLAAHLVSFALLTVMIVALADKIGPYAAKAAAYVFTMSWNYATSAFFVFRAGPATPDAEETP